jgi:peptidoglycan LD-endopeptidase LytH
VQLAAQRRLQQLSAILAAARAKATAGSGNASGSAGGGGGGTAYVQGQDGNTCYYAHLSDYVGGARAVAAGELIGHVGNTGDAAGGPTHLHFEIRRGGPNGRAIDPYPTLAAHCG